MGGMHGLYIANNVWQQAGQTVKGAATAAEAIKLGNLDWTVSKVQNTSTTPAGLIVPVNSYTIFRDTDNQELGTVGKGFIPYQNERMFAFLDSLIEENGGAHYDTVGALGKGERVWISIRLPKADFAVMGEDQHQLYLVFMQGHDGSLSRVVLMSETRIVCQNTFNRALHDAQHLVRVKHTKNGDARLDRVKDLVQGVVQDAETLKKKFEQLAQRRMTRESSAAILDRLFPKTADKGAAFTKRESVLEQVLNLYADNDGNAYPQFKDTAYNMFNALTNYADHQKAVRVTAGRKGTSVDQLRAQNAISGDGDEFKREALKAVVELTAGAPVHRIVSYPSVRKEVDLNTPLLDQVVKDQIVN